MLSSLALRLGASARTLASSSASMRVEVRRPESAYVPLGAPLLRERRMDGANEDEASVSIDALSGGGEAGCGLLRGCASVWRGTCMPSIPELDGESDEGDGTVVGEEGGGEPDTDDGIALKVIAFALALPGGESDPPEWLVGSCCPLPTVPVPGTTAILFAPAPESIDRSVVGFVDAYDLNVRWVGA